MEVKFSNVLFGLVGESEKNERKLFNRMLGSANTNVYKFHLMETELHPFISHSYFLLCNSDS